MNYSSRVNSVPARFIRPTYLMIVKMEKVNMCEIVKQQLLDNIEKLKKTKNVVFVFDSLLTHLFFQLIISFLGMPDPEWDSNTCTMSMINQYYRKKLEERKK